MFFTEVKIPKTPGAEVAHGQKIWTIGSCFADEIGGRMADSLFDIRVNPCGTLYNPLSIASALNRIISGEPYTEQDIFMHAGLWHCMDFHSSFSGSDPAMVLGRINSAISSLHNELPSLGVLTLTLGSARAFIDRTTGRVAANCHKLPADRFSILDLRAGDITEALQPVIQQLRTIAPGLTVIITVSPIRHKAYGFHADRLSKANLLIAADELCHRLPETYYFPAYEIMNDELRDYRFYAPDMIHPSEVACNHIYGKFAEAFFSDSTKKLAEDAMKFSRRLSHRPLSANTPEFRAFINGTMQKSRELQKAYPVIAPVINEKATRFLSAAIRITAKE